MSMFRRALAGASATVLLTGALLAGTAAPASAELSTHCPYEQSTRLFTANDGAYRLWLYQPAGDTAYVCFAENFLGGARGVLVLRGVGGPLVPAVPEAGDECPDWISIEDPVDLRIQFDNWYGEFICFGIEGVAVSLDYSVPIPSTDLNAELWLDKNTYVGQTWCSLSPDSEGCDYWNAQAVRVI